MTQRDARLIANPELDNVPRHQLAGRKLRLLHEDDNVEDRLSGSGSRVHNPGVRPLTSFPPRRTLACSDCISFRASRAFSALLSCEDKHEQ